MKSTIKISDILIPYRYLIYRIHLKCLFAYKCINDMTLGFLEEDIISFFYDNSTRLMNWSFRK